MFCRLAQAAVQMRRVGVLGASACVLMELGTAAHAAVKLRAVEEPTSAHDGASMAFSNQADAHTLPPSTDSSVSAPAEQERRGTVLRAAHRASSELIVPVAAAADGLVRQGLPVEPFVALVACHVMYLAQNGSPSGARDLKSVFQEGARTPRALLDTIYASLYVMPRVRPENISDPFFLPSLFKGETEQVCLAALMMVGVVLIFRLLRVTHLG